MSSYSDDLRDAALAYHRLPRPGKLEIQAIKPLANQRDLALAYSPGVAAACMAIANDPSQAASLTIRANLVAVVSNGTAVLGLGNIGRRVREIVEAIRERVDQAIDWVIDRAIRLGQAAPAAPANSTRSIYGALPRASIRRQ